LLYVFDGREPEIGRDVYISDQAVVIGDVKIGDGSTSGILCPPMTHTRKA